MKKFSWITALLVFVAQVPTTANALSCRKPDPVITMGYALERGTPFTLLEGSVSNPRDRKPEDVKFPEGTSERERKALSKHRKTGYDEVYDFKGVRLSADAPPEAIQTVLTIRVRCTGPWCGKFPPRSPQGNSPDGRALFIAEGTADDGYIVKVGPCGGQVFSTPLPPQTILELRKCMSPSECRTR